MANSLGFRTIKIDPDTDLEKELADLGIQF
jgi:hypothetical protein